MFSSQIKTLLYFITCSISSISSGFSQAPEIEWQNDIGGNQWDIARSIVPTADGGYIVGGASYSPVSGDKTEGFMGLYDLWIIKLDSLGNIEWQNTIGGNSYEGYYGFVIKQTSDGGYIVGTHSGSDLSGDKTEPFLGMNYFWGDYWVLKLDASGNIEWQNTIGGSGNDVMIGLQITPDGGYIVGGWSDSPVSYDKTEPSFGIFDYWILKINSTGNIEWQKTIGGDQNDYLTSLQLTSDGGFIATGYSESHASGDKSEESIGSSDYWIVKLDSIGNIIWENTVGGTGGDYAAGGVPTLDNGYMIGGYSFSGIGGDKTESQIGFADYWIVKIDSSGNIEWDKTIGGGDNDYMYCVSQTVQGEYLLGGTSNSGATGDKTEPSMGSYDMWVLRLDTIGNILWDNTIGGYGDDGLYSMEQAVDSTFILAGYSNSIASGDKSEDYIGDIANYDYWIVKLFRECDFTTFYADTDGDNYGDTENTISICDTIPPAGFVVDNTDCNDTVASIYPGAFEICNETDDNCNFLVDEGLPLNTYYIDADEDSFGNVLISTTTCSGIPPEGFVADSTDCNDDNLLIHAPAIFYADADGDLFGDPFTGLLFCEFIPPPGYVINNLDCNDDAILINPVTNEICNNIDDNCNDEIDEGLSVQTLFADEDGDNFGNAILDTITCLLAIPGYVSDSADCDDNDPDIYPGAPEILNGVDDNCNKLIDEGVGVFDPEIPEFTLYPNPATDKLSIVVTALTSPSESSAVGGHLSLTVTDLSGNIITQFEINSSKFEIDISELSAGVYFITGKFNDNVSVQKFIKL